MFKTCSKCKITKSLELFYPYMPSKDGRRSSCKECHKKWKLDNSEYVKNYYKKNKEKYKFRSIKNRYGLSENEYNQLNIKQNGLCCICKITSNNPLHVDHDHKTGKIRGLLCEKCNPAIRLLNEDPKIIKSALDYLSK